MHPIRPSSSRAVVIVTLLAMLALGRASFAQAPALPEQLISTAEVHAIIEESNLLDYSSLYPKL